MSALFRVLDNATTALHNRPLTNELLPNLKDAVFRHQLGANDFTSLDEECLLIADIVPTHHKAHQVLKGAHKTGMIDAITGRPDTTKVTKNMVHDMPVLGGISKQREFVMLLFFWEEEIQRWEGFEAEQRRVKEEGGDGEVLQILEAKKRIVPSLREADGRESLPKYEAGGR